MDGPRSLPRLFRFKPIAWHSYCLRLAPAASLSALAFAGVWLLGLAGVLARAAGVSKGRRWEVTGRRGLLALGTLMTVFALMVSGVILALSGTVQAQTDESAPAKPTGLTGTVTHASVSLAWDDPEDSSITSYQILRRDKSIHETGEFAVLVGDTQTSATSYVDTDVEAVGKYVYRVKARNSAGLSPQNSFVNAKLPAPPEPTPLPHRRPLPSPRRRPHRRLLLSRRTSPSG